MLPSRSRQQGPPRPRTPRLLRSGRSLGSRERTGRKSGMPIRGRQARRLTGSRASLQWRSLSPLTPSFLRARPLMTSVSLRMSPLLPMVRLNRFSCGRNSRNLKGDPLGHEAHNHETRLHLHSRGFFLRIRPSGP